MCSVEEFSQRRPHTVFFESPKWRARNYGDYLLHAIANANLDLTIRTIIYFINALDTLYSQRSNCLAVRRENFNEMPARKVVIKMILDVDTNVWID